jgi:hypothetical protein
MEKYLFGFSWDDPEEAEAYRRLGVDFEAGCATGVFIEASDKDEAISWGITIAEGYLSYIYEDNNYSLKDLGFHCWIEDDPTHSSWKHCLDFFQRIEVGVLPDFRMMTAQAYGDWCKRNGIS